MMHNMCTVAHAGTQHGQCCVTKTLMKSAVHSAGSDCVVGLWAVAIQLCRVSSVLC